MEALEKTRIYSVRSEPIRKLHGFRKHHDVPTAINHRTLEWLDRLTQERMDGLISNVFDALKKSYGLKRRQLSVHGPVQRHAVIETPFFNFEAFVEFDEKTPEQILWTSEINRIRDVEFVVCKEFDSCFPNTSWKLQVPVDNPLDLADIVDRIEENDDLGLTVEYDKDLNWCEIRSRDCQATLRATSNSFYVSRSTDSSPRQLLLSLVQFQSQLTNQIGPFEMRDGYRLSG